MDWLLDPSLLDSNASVSLLMLTSICCILSTRVISIQLIPSCRPPNPISKFSIRSLFVVIVNQALIPIDRSLSQQVIKDKKQTQMYSALGENKPQLILLNIENECVLCLIAEFKYRN
jgi:hypothetical protein